MEDLARTSRATALVALLLALWCSGALAGIGADSIAWTTRLTDANLLGVTLTNYGFLGNNFTSRAPSLEYPLGSRFEHLPEAGLWVGARAVDVYGEFHGVSTACIEGSPGPVPAGRSEFTPGGTTLLVRSRLTGSPDYDPNALSDQDVECLYRDQPARNIANSEPARPMGLLVRQTSFAWSVGDLAHVLFLRYVVRAEGAALQDAWVGLWTELASGFRDDYSCWPPSTSCSTTGGWFKKKWVQYDDSLRLLREHYCAGQPVPGGCNLAHVPCWVGVRLLGVSPGSLSDPDQHVTLAAWSWSAGSPYRDEDVERYALLSSGLVSPLLGDSLLPFTGDPVELLAAGPFQVASGDSVTVDFALVGGAEVADLQQHARTAQQFYDAGFDLTVPVRASLVSADAGDGRVRLVWYVAEGREDWTVLRSRDGAAWGPIGTVSPDGAGYARFEDAGAAPGVRWGYRLRAPEGDTYGEAWVDVPPAATLALQGARPNPAVRGGLRVAFTLAERGPVRIEVFDPAGRRVLTRDLGDLPPGPHEVDLARPAGTRPGTCFIRLRQGNGTRTARAVLLE